MDAARNAVDTLKARKGMQQETTKALRGHLQKIDDKLSAHPLSQRRADKAEENNIAKTDLQRVLDDLARAQSLFEFKISKRDDALIAMQTELADDEDDDEIDDADDDDD